MTVMSDTPYRAAWFHCEDCKRCGSMIELASEAWGLNVEATVRKLLAEGALIPGEGSFEHHLQIYEENFIDRHRRHAKFWEEARLKLTADDSIILRSLQQKLGLRLELDRERWLNGPGQFVGGSDRRTIEFTYTPGLREDTYTHSSDQVFRGGNWTDMFVIPCYDMPGRIKGYYFIGRGGNIPIDTVFRPIVRSSAQDRDAGLFMLPAAKARPEYQETVVVLPSILPALRLHVRHFQDNSDTLPLVVYWEDKKWSTSPHIWGTVPATFVFWGPPENIVNTIKHARAANGLVSTHPWPQDRKAWNYRTPAEWMHLARKTVPWEHALEKALTEMPANKGEELMLQARVTTEEKERIIAELPPVIRRRYQQPTAIWRVIKDDKTEIIETDKGWIYGKTKALITDAILRVERAVHHPKTDTIHYGGHILYQGQKVTFYETAHNIQTHTGFWMQELIVKAGLGFPVINQKWGNKLFDWATRFQAPEPARGYEHIGWDEDHGEACFVFPGYLIKSGGAVEDESSSLLIAPKKGAPGHLKKPQGLSYEDVQLLSADTYSVRLLWANATCVLASLLSPVMNEQYRAHGIQGPGATTAIAIARLLGCSDGNTTTKNPHGWPFVVDTDGDGKRNPFLGWLSLPTTPNAMARVTWHAAQALRCRDGWNIVNAADYVGNVRDIVTVAPRLIPNYLLHLARSHFRLAANRTGILTVTDSLREWLVEQHGDPIALNAGLTMIDDYNSEQEDERVVDAFFNILCSLYDEGLFMSVREGFDNRELKAKHGLPRLVVRKTGELFIPKAGVNNALRRKRAPMIDSPMVTRALTVAGILHADGELLGNPGWYVDDKYWTEQMTKWQERKHRSFRVVG